MHLLQWVLAYMNSVWTTLTISCMYEHAISVTFLMPQGNRRETRLLGILSFVHSTVWKVLFGKVKKNFPFFFSFLFLFKENFWSGVVVVLVCKISEFLSVTHSQWIKLLFLFSFEWFLLVYHYKSHLIYKSWEKSLKGGPKLSLNLREALTGGSMHALNGSLNFLWRKPYHDYFFILLYYVASLNHMQCMGLIHSFIHSLIIVITITVTTTTTTSIFFW